MTAEICRWATGSDRSQRQRQVTSHSVAASFSHHGCHVDLFSAGQLRLRQGSWLSCDTVLGMFAERASPFDFDCGFGRPPPQTPGQHLFCLGSIAQSSLVLSSPHLNLLMQKTQETSGTFLKTLRHLIPASPGAVAEPSHIKVCRVDT
jgi:hypothetical protein